MNIKEFLAIGACNGLKVYDNRFKYFGNDKCVYDLVITGSNLQRSLTESMESNEIKPICFPLDQLTNPIQIKDYNGGEPFVPIAELIKSGFGSVYQFDGNLCYFNGDEYDYKIENIAFGAIQILISWHFSVGLSDNEFIPVTEDFNPYK